MLFAQKRNKASSTGLVGRFRLFRNNYYHLRNESEEQKRGRVLLADIFGLSLTTKTMLMILTRLISLVGTRLGALTLDEKVVETRRVKEVSE